MCLPSSLVFISLSSLILWVAFGVTCFTDERAKMWWSLGHSYPFLSGGHSHESHPLCLLTPSICSPWGCCETARLPWVEGWRKGGPVFITSMQCVNCWQHTEPMMYTIDETQQLKTSSGDKRLTLCLEVNRTWALLCDTDLLSALSRHKSSKTFGILERVCVFLN